MESTAVDHVAVRSMLHNIVGELVKELRKPSPDPEKVKEAEELLDHGELLLLSWDNSWKTWRR